MYCTITHYAIKHYPINKTSVLQKIRLACITGMISLLPWQLSWAQACTGSNCKIDVLFEGTYIENTCDVSINNGTSAEVVTLPTISTATLQNDGAEAGSQSFDITLKTCPASKTISLRYIGGGLAPDTTTGNIINAVGTDYSEKVQIRIRNGNGQQMIIDDVNSTQDYLIPATGEDVTHHFLASYYAKGTGVTSGLVSGMTYIDLIYR